MGCGLTKVVKKINVSPFLKARSCKTIMGGKVLIALDKTGNEQSLCHFSDDSFLK